MQYIISANYRDRSDAAHPWLVRTPDQVAEDAKPVASLTARNVQFKDSSELEKGFGCEIVAVSSDVTFASEPDDIGAISRYPVGRGLKFAGYTFISKKTGADVTEVDTLVLSNDRKVTDVTEGVEPDETHATKSPRFSRGDRVVFNSDENRLRNAPGDMIGDGDMIVLSYATEEDDDAIWVHYNDGRAQGNTHWINASHLKLA